MLLLGPYRSVLGLSKSEAITFSIIYWIAAAGIISAWYMNWLASLGSIGSFAIYWALISAIQVIAFTYLWLRTKHPDIKGASWIVIYNIILGIISYMGSLGPLSTPIIPYPWDYLTWALLSLIVYLIAIKVAYLTTDLKQIKESGLPIE
ncbi:MAG: hypothetical protein RXQ96_06735 [Thermocladium sp.]